LIRAKCAAEKSKGALIASAVTHASIASVMAVLAGQKIES
jgi:hypothetical protein